MTFFNEVESLLMNPSPRADAQLSEAVRGQRFRCPIQAAAALENSRGAGMVIPFRAKFAPPLATQFLPYAMEQGTADVVRCRYAVESLILEVSQAKQIIGLRIIDRKATPIADPSAAIAVVAGELLQIEGFVPFEVGQEAGLHYGRNQPLVPSPWGVADWFYALKWWVAPQEYGFVSLKAPASPARTVYSSSLEDNRQWFRRRT